MLPTNAVVRYGVGTPRLRTRTQYRFALTPNEFRSVGSVHSALARARKRIDRNDETEATSPKYCKVGRLWSISMANRGRGTVRRPAADLVSSTRLSPSPGTRTTLPVTASVPAGSSYSTLRKASSSEGRRPVAMSSVMSRRGRGPDRTSTRRVWPEALAARRL